MTRIAVFCDGTWNSPTIAEPTSIHKLYTVVESDPAKEQVAAYFRGIGTDDRFDGKFKKTLNKYGGGIFGWGLDAKVKQAYQFISMVYKPGDEIYLFGFSRGAYTARSIAGMLRKCGIADDTSPEGINRAFALYRKRGKRNHPDKPHILKERLAISPRFATSSKDVEWRDGDADRVHIAFLGVFDTVGARGIPSALFGPLATLWNSQYKFHDNALSSSVRSARHALAIDERRVFYKPAIWDNLDELNSGKRDALRPYQQVWFVGTHGIVGGSATAQALGAIPFNWVLQGAGKLALKPDVSPDMPEENPLEITEDITDRWHILKSWRIGPKDTATAHASVGERVRHIREYRPQNLKTLISHWMG